MSGANPSGWAGLLAYRSGDADSAVNYVGRAQELNPTDFSRDFNLSVLAMAQHERDQPNESRSALAEASQLITRLDKDPGNKGHHDLLIAKILFREAEGMIQDRNDSANEATDTTASSDKRPPATETTDKDAPDKD